MKLRPPPWQKQWHLKGLYGIEEIWDLYEDDAQHYWRKIKFHKVILLLSIACQASLTTRCVSFSSGVSSTRSMISSEITGKKRRWKISKSCTSIFWNSKSRIKSMRIGRRRSELPRLAAISSYLAPGRPIRCPAALRRSLNRNLDYCLISCCVI